MIAPSAAERTDTPVSILVVDDRKENRLALRAILADPTYRIVEAGSGPEALRRLLDDEFAVLLVDVVMPEMSGFELAAAIKARRRTATVPILFLTAHATDTELIYKGYRAGAVDYLVKPLVPDMVQAKVAVFAELYRQKRRIEHQAELLVESARREGDLRLVELRLASERHYQSLADAVPNIIWTARPDGYIDYFNHRWFEYTGISAERAAGSWQGAIHDDDVVRCVDAWTEALQSERMFEVECRLRHARDDVFRWHLARAVPERGPGGQIVAWLGSFTDVEDQKRAHATLAEFKGTLDAVLDAVLIFEPDTWRLVYANAGAHILLGHSHDGLSKLRPTDFLTEHDEARFRELLQALDGERMHRIVLDTRCRRKDGREVPVEFSFQIVQADGDHIVAIARDITERKLAELEREHLYGEALDAIHARDEFLSVASHELRTPLSSLKLQMDMLTHPGRRAAVPCELVPKLELAGRQVDKLSRLVSQLMDVSRITAGRLQLELEEEVDLSAIAGDVVTRFRDDATKAGCEVTLRADVPVRGKWDSLRMDQVVTNLLTNALKFGAGKSIQIDVTRTEASAHLVVRDHGIGIRAEEIERVFQRFERAASARSYAGMGLGLYIVREIVEAHGGTVRVESQPGAGCTFTVDLPLTPSVAMH